MNSSRNIVDRTKQLQFTVSLMVDLVPQRDENDNVVRDEDDEILNDLLVNASRNNHQLALRARCRCEHGQAIFEVSAAGGDQAAGHYSPQQRLSWSILRQFAARNGGALEPQELAPASLALHRLILPLFAPAS